MGVSITKKAVVIFVITTLFVFFYILFGKEYLILNKGDKQSKDVEAEKLSHVNVVNKNEQTIEVSPSIKQVETNEKDEEAKVNELLEFINSPCKIDNLKEMYRDKNLSDKEQAVYQVGILDNKIAREFSMNALTMSGAKEIVSVWLTSYNVSDEERLNTEITVLKFSGYALIESNYREGIDKIHSEYQRLREQIEEMNTSKKKQKDIFQKNTQLIAYIGAITDIMAWEEMIKTLDGADKLHRLNKNSDEFFQLMSSTYTKFQLL